MKLMTWSAGKWQSTRMRCRCLAMLHACSTAPASLLTSTSVFLRSFSIGYSFCPFEGSRIIVFHDTCRPRRRSPCPLTPVFRFSSSSSKVTHVTRREEVRPGCLCAVFSSYALCFSFKNILSRLKWRFPFESLRQCVASRSRGFLRRYSLNATHQHT